MGKAARLRKALNAGSANAAPQAGASRRALFARIREGVVGIVDAADDWPTTVQANQTVPMTAIRLIGTGFVIDNGIVLTAKHVVQHFIDRTVAWEANKVGPRPRPPKFLFSTAFLGAKQTLVDMQFSMGAASQISAANEYDMASLRIAPPPPGSGITLPRPLKLSPIPCEEGDDVAICGYPLGWNLHQDYFGGFLLNASFSKGIVSAVFPHPEAPIANRNMFQIDAMINPGNSGGPVFNIRTGEVVGIVVSRTENVIQTAPGQLLGGEDKIVIATGLARALPIHLAQFVIKSIEDAAVGLLQP